MTETSRLLRFGVQEVEEESSSLLSLTHESEQSKKCEEDGNDGGCPTVELAVPPPTAIPAQPCSGQQPFRRRLCPHIQFSLTLEQTFSLVVLVTSISVLLLGILQKRGGEGGAVTINDDETSSSLTFLRIGSSTSLHPAVVLLFVGVLWQALLLWQGLVVALASLHNELWKATTDHQHAVMRSFAESHLYTYQVLQLVVDDEQHMNCDPQRITQLIHGSQSWMIFLTLLLTSCSSGGTTTADDDSTFRQLLSALALSVALACTLRMVSLRASYCRLDTLNTPTFLVMGVLSLQSTFSTCFVRLLRWSWQRWAEKPLSDNKKTNDDDSSACSRFTIFGALTTVVVLLVVATVLFFHVYEQHGPLSLVVGMILMGMHGLLQGISVSFDNLSTREQQVALNEITRAKLQSFDRHVLSTVLVVALAYLWTFPRSHEVSLPVVLLAMVATATVAASVGQIVVAWATDFPVAFLTSNVLVPCLVDLSAFIKPVTSIADVLHMFYHANYHNDTLYIGSTEERLAAASKLSQDDVEAPGWCIHDRIDSYPSSTQNPDVWLEEHEF